MPCSAPRLAARGAGVPVFEMREAGGDATDMLIRNFLNSQEAAASTATNAPLVGWAWDLWKQQAMEGGK